ncbi:MAG: ureidoglycolate lyase [Exilispira sp.]
MREIKYIDKYNFEKYGYILDFTEFASNGWEILFKEKSNGFRIAIFEIDRHFANRLERHPDSMETFEPINGTSLILLSDNNPDDFEVFLLNKPVCLRRGIWHEVISISEKTKFKIVENDEVVCQYHQLKSPFGFFVDYLS